MSSENYRGLNRWDTGRPPSGGGGRPQCVLTVNGGSSSLKFAAFTAAGPIERVLAGYDDEVRTPLPPPSAPAMRRMTIRLLRVLASGLETGRPAASTGRAAVAGFRGGLEGSTGARVVVEHTRVAMAVVQEAEAAVAAGVAIEPLGLPALHAVIDHALAAVTRGGAGRKAWT